MVLHEEITAQIAQGKNKYDIQDYLLEKGISKEDANAALNKHPHFKQVEQEQQKESGVSTKNILLALLFVVVALVRFGRAMDSGSLIAVIGVITAGGMVYVFLSKKG